MNNEKEVFYKIYIEVILSYRKDRVKLFRGEYEATVYDASGNELGTTTFDVNNDPRNVQNVLKIICNDHLRDICY